MAHPIPIEQLDLGGRTNGLLKREGIHTLADLRKYDELGLLDIYRFGRTNVLKVQAALEECGAGRLATGAKDELRRYLQGVNLELVKAGGHVTDALLLLSRLNPTDVEPTR